MHHRRLIQEKEKLLEEIKKLKSENEKYEPMLKQAQSKYEAMVKERGLISLERDKLAKKVVNLRFLLFL